VLTCRALAALWSWAIPFKAFPALCEFLRSSRPPELAILIKARLRQSLCIIRTMATRQFARVLRRPMMEAVPIYIYGDACTVGEWETPYGGWGFIVTRGENPGRRGWFAQMPFCQAWQASTDINLREFANLCFAAVVGMRFAGRRIVIYSDSEVAIAWFMGTTTASVSVDCAMAQIRIWAEQRHCEIIVIHIAGEVMPADRISRRPFGPSEVPEFPATPPVHPPRRLNKPVTCGTPT